MNEAKPTLRDYTLFAEAWVFLLRARWMLLFRPFSKIVPVMRNTVSECRSGDEALLFQVRLAIARASIRSPWRTKCFEQALAARMMLSRRGVATQTFFGVLKNDSNALEAHAWLKSGDFVVTGWRRMDQYTVVGVF